MTVDERDHRPHKSTSVGTELSLRLLSTDSIYNIRPSLNAHRSFQSEALKKKLISFKTVNAVCFLLTPTTLAGVRRSSASVCVSVCLSA